MIARISEEADTRLLLHAEHASKNSYRSVIIVSEDTDVLVLCLAYQSRIPSSLYQKCGSQTRARFVDIATIRQAFGEELCNALPGIHSFTGCDTVSAFAGRVKVRAVTLAKRDRPTLEMFQQLGTTWHLSDDIFNRLQKFTCVLYSATKTQIVSALSDTTCFVQRKEKWNLINCHLVKTAYENTVREQTIKPPFGDRVLKPVLTSPLR